MLVMSLLFTCAREKKLVIYFIHIKKSVVTCFLLSPRHLAPRSHMNHNHLFDSFLCF